MVPKGAKKIVCVVSGGGLDTGKLVEILSAPNSSGIEVAPPSQCPYLTSLSPDSAIQATPIGRRSGNNGGAVSMLVAFGLGAAAGALLVNALVKQRL
jgi:hypothetical protein